MRIRSLRPRSRHPLDSFKSQPSKSSKRMSYWRFPGSRSAMRRTNVYFSKGGPSLSVCRYRFSRNMFSSSWCSATCRLDWVALASGSSRPPFPQGSCMRKSTWFFRSEGMGTLHRQKMGLIRSRGQRKARCSSCTWEDHRYTSLWWSCKKRTG